MSEPRVSDAELAEWIKQAEEYAAGDWQMDDAPYFGAAVFDLRDARARIAELERERDDERTRRMLADASPDLNRDAIGMARAHIKEHMGISAAFFDDVIHNVVATCLQRDASIAALVEALARCMSGDPRNSAKWQHALDVLADHAAFAAERDERLRAEVRSNANEAGDLRMMDMLAAGNALAEAAEHLLYCDLGRWCDDCNKARTVIAAWREAAK